MRERLAVIAFLACLPVAAAWGFLLYACRRARVPALLLLVAAPVAGQRNVLQFDSVFVASLYSEAPPACVHAGGWSGDTLRVAGGPCDGNELGRVILTDRAPCTLVPQDHADYLSTREAVRVLVCPGGNWKAQIRAGLLPVPYAKPERIT